MCSALSGFPISCATLAASNVSTAKAYRRAPGAAGPAAGWVMGRPWPCELPPGATIQIHGPHGHFVLNEPVTDSILIGTGTGVAPMRAFAEWLFPEGGLDRSNGKEIWLVYGTRHETDIYYKAEFEALDRRVPNFHYLPTLSRALDDWTGLRGHVQVHIQKIVEDRAARLGLPLPAPPVDPATPAAQLNFDIYAYICGLNFMVSGVRDLLTGFGWHKKQIVFERYD